MVSWTIHSNLARTFITTGKLVALNREEAIIQVQGRDGIVHAHFPRLGFSFEPAVAKGNL